MEPYPIPLHYQNSNARAWFVAVYMVGTNYGGPEEGGWWYEVGDIVSCEVWPSQEQANARAEVLQEVYPNTGKRSSFGQDKEDHDVVVTDTLPAPSFPAVTPHYE